jgi:hypothetical protein
LLCSPLLQNGENVFTEDSDTEEEREEEEKEGG